MKVSTKPSCPDKLKKLMREFKMEVRIKHKKLNKKAEHWTDIIRTMPKKWGLVKKSHSGMSDVLFISKKHGFIVKRPWCVGEPTQTPRCAIFTMRVPFKLRTDEDYDEELATPLFLQPLADVNSEKSYEAFDIINDSRYCDELNDLHEGNVGVYNGKAVVIDW